MTLDDLVDSLGRPVPQKIKAPLLDAILKTIAHPESDITAVIRRAQALATRAVDGEIRDVLRYATKGLFEVSLKERRVAQRNAPSAQPPSVIASLAGEAVEGSPAAIEARILLDQLLSNLPTLERDVFVRYISGYRHTRIARELDISVAMSSYYLQRAKARLRAAAMSLR